MKNFWNISLLSVLILSLASACAPQRRLLNGGPIPPAANKQTGGQSGEQTGNGTTNTSTPTCADGATFQPTSKDLTAIQTQDKFAVQDVDVLCIVSGFTDEVDPKARALMVKLTFKSGEQFTFAAMPKINDDGTIPSSANSNGHALLLAKSSAKDVTAECATKNADLKSGIETCGEVKFTAAISIKNAQGEQPAILRVHSGRNLSRLASYEIRGAGASKPDLTGVLGSADLKSDQIIIVTRSSDQTAANTPSELESDGNTKPLLLKALTSINVKGMGANAELTTLRSQHVIGRALYAYVINVTGFPAADDKGNKIEKAVTNNGMVDITHNRDGQINQYVVAVPVLINKEAKFVNLIADLNGSAPASSDSAESRTSVQNSASPVIPVEAKPTDGKPADSNVSDKKPGAVASVANGVKTLVRNAIDKTQAATSNAMNKTKEVAQVVAQSYPVQQQVAAAKAGVQVVKDGAQAAKAEMNTDRWAASKVVEYLIQKPSQFMTDIWSKLANWLNPETDKKN